MRRGIFQSAILTWAALVSLSASSASAEGYIPAQDQRLRLGNAAEPRELDPAKATGVPESRILYNLFEGLTSLDPVTLEPIPGVAESWQISKDGRTYTFKIRKNAKWSDGRPLTAEDFVKSWHRALSPELASEYAYQLYYLVNGREYNTGKIKDPKQVGVKALDTHILEVRLVHPTPYFLSLASFYTLFPTPAHMIAQYPGQEWTKEGKMVGNGPFQLAEWKLNQHVKMLPNPHYWDKDQVRLQEVFFLPIENGNTEEKSFFSGELQITSTVPVTKVPVYLQEKAKQPGRYHPFRSEPYLGVYYYRFNVTKPPFDDVRVRKALILAIDRKLIVERIMQGGQKPGTALTPPNVGGYQFDSWIPASLDESKDTLKEARKLLAEAGFPEGKGFPKVSILYNTNENHKKVALAIQQMWRKNLGIRVGLFNQEWKVYLNSMSQLDYHIARSAWIGDYNDPMTFLDMMVTDGGNNRTGWSNKDYDQLIAKAASSTDTKVRHETFQAAEKILLQELPIMPIYFYTSTKLISEKVKLVRNGKLVDWQSNIQDLILLKHYALAE